MPLEIDLDQLMNRSVRIAPTIDPKKTWLHVTDMQVTCTDPRASGYLVGGGGAPSGDDCVEACNKVIRRCREEGIAGISWSKWGVRDDGLDAGLYNDKVRFWYPNGGSDGKLSDPETEIDPRMDIRPDEEPVFYRPKFSAFNGTILENLLTANRIEYLIITGLSTSYCVRNTAIDAWNLNIRAIVLADTTTAYDEDPENPAYKEALKNVQGTYGDVLTSDELFVMFDEARSANGKVAANA
jgi:nicotinamidase-related amidase